jgi:hypothetical protein
MAINTVSGNTMLTSGSFPPVRAATTGSNIDVTAGSLLVVDGVQLVAGDRVLVKIRPTQQQKVFTRPIPARGCARQMPAPTRNASPAWRSRWRSAPSMRGQTFICTCADDPVVVGTSLITFAAQSMVASATQGATSTTSVAIGVGSKTFAVQAGRAFQAGQAVLINESSNNANQMFGTVTAYSGTSLTVNVTATGGSGTHADWTIVHYPSNAAAGFAPPIGTGNVTEPGSSTPGHVATSRTRPARCCRTAALPQGLPTPSRRQCWRTRPRRSSSACSTACWWRRLLAAR